MDLRKHGPALALRLAPLLLLLVVVLGALHAAGRHPTEDAPHMLGISMRLAWEIRELRLGQALVHWLSLVAPHPPGAYLPAVLGYALLGPAEVVPLLGGLIWLLLLRNGLHRLLEAQGCPERIWVLDLGLAATPLIWRQLDNYGVDIASAALAMQALSWLVKSRALRDRRASAFTGLWLGLGFWVKYTFPIALLLPCAVVGVLVLVDRVRKPDEGWTRLLNAAVLCGVMLIPLGPLMVVSGENILGYVLHSAEGADEIIGNLGSAVGDGVSALDQQAFYPAAVKDLWGWPGLGLLLVGVGVGFWEQRKQPLTPVLLLLAFLGSMAVLTRLDIKANRYLLPGLVPLLALGLTGLARRWTIPLAPLVLAAPILFLWRDYSGWTHGQSSAEVRAWGAVPAEERLAPSSRSFEHMASTQLRSWGAWPRVEEPFRPLAVYPEQWQVAEVVAELALRQPDPEGMVGLCLTERSGTPGFGVYLMEAERQDLHWDFVTVMMLRGEEPGGGPRTFRFKGPFRSDDAEVPLPSSIFVTYGGNGPQKRYLDHLRGQDARRFELPTGLVGEVVSLPDGR